MPWLKSAGRLDEVAEAASVHKLHCEKWRPIIVAKVPDRDDVRMETTAGGSCFSPKALQPLLGAASGYQFGPQNLDRNQAIDDRVIGAINFSHRTRADQPLDAIAADRLTGFHFSTSQRLSMLLSLAPPAWSLRSAGFSASC